ncbi:hypothetical protein TBLA_0F01870 [Henningerozyma blattae CBS 6284]|uniref:YARHG domain-containing protein n=1 Tax=Henningerozyma blattae (strain ATCC 34711 / CBS 6284 / DSM 70876 / NBRC 10599 / NRRL Y-10934 / UCD 77-7) TaxID=1071380 RepID=I2H5S7_HENB6|nr:hypothetical protein TBLA_0F01870 [Tetrapisispora blattae CBS 6284]CCH61729.1 hypothetical protein TBLA_0F01870 [Tetrapisispora blattae CBS 6284]
MNIIILQLSWLLWVSCIISSTSSGPITKESLKKGFYHADAFCSPSYTNGDGSLINALEVATNIDFPPFIKKKSKGVYTGFKFLKILDVQLTTFSIKRTIVLFYCNRSQIEWKKVFEIDKDIDWNKPICEYIPKKEPPPNTSIGKQLKSWFTFWEKPKKSTLLTAKEKAKNDLNHMFCFKLARKKFYSFYKDPFYLKNSWAGGIFYSNFSTIEKLDFIKNQLSDDLIFPKDEFKIYADEEHTIPLAPLITDNFDNYWWEWTNSGEPFGYRKYIPFMYTPNNVISIADLNNLEAKNATMFLEPLLGNFMRQDIDRKADNFLNIVTGEYSRYGEKPWEDEIDYKENYEFTEIEFANSTRFIDHTIKRVTPFYEETRKRYARLIRTNQDIYERIVNFAKSTKLPNLDETLWKNLDFGDKFGEVITDSKEMYHKIRNDWYNLQGK